MHSTVRREVSLSIAVSLWIFSSAVSPAQSTPPPTTPPPEEPTLVQRPTLSITTREVLMDVVVTDGSRHPVTGLKASDFVVTEEGQSQSITHLEEHHPLTATELASVQKPALPPNTFSNYNPVPNSNAYTVLLLDAMDTPVTAQMYVREQLIGFLKRVQPGTPIAIFQIDSEMRLIQGFSSDP